MVEPMRHVRGRVSAVRQISPGFTRVTLASDDFDLMGDGGPYLDARVKLVFGAEGAGVLAEGELSPGWYVQWRQEDESVRGQLRTFSIVASRPGEIDVDFAVHSAQGEAAAFGAGHGPAAQWIAQASVGQQMSVLGPNLEYWRDQGTYGGTEFIPGSCRKLVLIGDATALPAIESILSSWEQVGLEGSRAMVFVEVDSAQDERALGREGVLPAGMSVQWVHRVHEDGALAHGQRLVQEVLSSPVPEFLGVRGASGGAIERVESEYLESRARSLASEEAEDLWWERADESGGSFVWVAGEQSAVKAIRRFFVKDCGLDKQSVAFMGYWRLGKRHS